MNLSFFNRAVPHLIAIGIFILVAVVYCAPALQGKVLNQHDTQGWTGMAQQSIEFKDKYGHIPYWSNSMFSGMPGYSFAFEPPIRISISSLHSVFTLGLPKPINFFFLACVMMYFLLMVLKINPWIGVMGGIAYAYSTYDPVIISVGHDTKMICLGYAPAVIASLLLIIQKKYIEGTVLTALFASLIIVFNHIQITYYTLILALCIGIAFAIDALRKGDWKHIITTAALACLAGGIALLVNTVPLWPLNEYAKETMRGGRSELTDTTNLKNKSKGGLNKDYAFSWSYGIPESFTVIVPGIYGGSNGGNQIKEGSSKFAEKLSEIGMPEENGLQYANAYAYWGDQPNTAGPVYLGAIICFLFILGMVYEKSWLKWGIFAACIIGFILSWGKNLQAINYFLFDYLPLYNKFRAPSMALVIPQLAFIVLGSIAANDILFGNLDKNLAWKRFKLAGIITGAVFAFLIIQYFSFSYIGGNDSLIRDNFASGIMQQMAQGQQPGVEVQQKSQEIARSVMTGLQDDRKTLFGKDLLRSLILVLIVAGAMGLYLKGKVSRGVALTILVLLTSFDLLAVGKRYLNNNNFIDPTEFEAPFTINAADQTINADPDKNFRVFDQTTGDPFSDARTSYHHNSIGGYNAAKLALYEDIKNHQLLKGNLNVFNMLNTKYFIVPNPSTQQPEAKLNPGAYGNVWFVKGIRFVKNADEEMRSLDNTNLKDTAVIDERFRSFVSSQPQFDSTATIRLVENLNDKVTYKSSTPSNQFAVFSEIYYPHGWDAYVDDKKQPYVRVDYALRGMTIPAGSHTITFRFEPKSVIVGSKISTAVTILLYLMLAGLLAFEFRKRKYDTSEKNSIKTKA